MTLSVMVGFWRKDDGAVTVDWVALTAAVLAVGIAVIYAVFEVGVSSAILATSDTVSSVSMLPVPEPPSWALE